MASTQIEPIVKLPEIVSKGVYEGQIRDRCPQLKAAGKLTASGESALTCLKPEKRPESPDVIKRFRASFRPDAGKQRVLYGKANDPHRTWAAETTHGVNTPASIQAGTLINPSPNTLFHQRIIDKQERIYASHAKAPVGRSHDQTPGLGSHIDKHKFTFGVYAEKDGSAAELLSPNKSMSEIFEDSQKGRNLYKLSHSNFLPGERRERNYSHDSFNQNLMFGLPTPHDNTGKRLEQSLKWLHDERCEKLAPIVSKRADDFRERTQPQLAKVHDPIKDTLKVHPDHTFGILVKPDEYGAGDLLHGRVQSEYLRGKDRIRGVVAAMRQHLKKENYHNFDNIMDAFKHLDKDNVGTIGVQELKAGCAQFNLPIDDQLVGQLVHYCDANGDGRIDYNEFLNFLNWKDKFPASFPERYSQSAPVETKLQKQIDNSAVSNRTSASMINAVVGGTSTLKYRTYGVPTVRSDIPAPRIKRVSDFINYGDQSNALGLCNPSLFSNYGVHEKEFLEPRSKQQIRDIFLNIGVQLDYDTFDRLYQVAESIHPKGQVSVESFRNVLDEARMQQLRKTAVL